MSETKYQRDMDPAKYAARRAELTKPPPQRVAVIAEGKHARDLTRDEYQAARRRLGARNLI